MNTIQTIIAGLAAVLILTSPVACTIHQQAMVAKAIASGSDPIAARCALEGSSSSSVICVVKATQQAAGAPK